MERTTTGTGPTTPAERRRVPAGVAFVLVAYAFAAVMLGTTMPTPLYPLYEQRYGIGEAVVTVIYAVYAVGVLSALVLLGRLSDQVGRRRALLPGIALSAGSAVLFLVAYATPAGLVAIFTGRVLSGLSAGIFTGTATVMLVELAPPRWQARASLVAAAVNMGGLGLGPLLAGVLAGFAPAPLVLPFAVDLGLLAVAAVVVLVSPETVRATGPFVLRPQKLFVPPEIRGTFVRAATAGFAGFCMLGLVTAVGPAFLAEVLHQTSHALTGLLVFSVLVASTVGQVAASAVGERRALPGGCAVLAAGLAVLVAALTTASLPVLVVAFVVAGFGQGMGFRAGLGAVTAASPPDHRAAVASSFFVVLYVAISIPVVGVGIAAQLAGLVPAGTAFAVLVGLLALAALVSLVRRRPAA